ncbi:MAG: C4-type zinc ribbon domain-containing protein [Desulfobacterales bacterium]|nr:C4-type zinc ribbon domain-containing protein [Desulfobacterales bacterium]
MDSHTLKEQIELLIDLQGKEIAAAQIDAELKKIPAQISEMDAGLAEIEKRFEEEKASLESLKKTYRTQEADIQTHQSRIQKRESQLRSVKTNQEYRAILKEIGGIKAEASRIEDNMLQCLDDTEAAEKGIAEMSREYKQEQAQISEKKAELEAYAESRRKARDKLLAERDEIMQHIHADMLKRYNFVKQQTGGVKVIVAAREGICMGCNMNIPPQLYNELHRGDEMKFCPHCHRMLYVL